MTQMAVASKSKAASVLSSCATTLEEENDNRDDKSIEVLPFLTENTTPAEASTTALRYQRDKYESSRSLLETSNSGATASGIFLLDRK